MTIKYSKVLGLICLVFTGLILYQLVNGDPANGVLAILRIFGGADSLAYPLTILLITIGFGFGLRALFWNKVCLGEQCDFK